MLSADDYDRLKLICRRVYSDQRTEEELEGELMEAFINGLPASAEEEAIPPLDPAVRDLVGGLERLAAENFAEIDELKKYIKARRSLGTSSA